MKRKQILIIGFGGNAIDCFETIENEFEVIGFVDDEKDKQKSEFKGIPVYSRAALNQYKDAKVISLIGSEHTFMKRKGIISDFKIPPSRFATIIHPNAVVSKDSVIGYDVIIMAGVVITSNAKIGNHIFILPNTVIHHDVKISDYVLIGSNVTIAGHVNINSNCYIGSGSSIISYAEIGNSSLIGMSANVIESVPDNSKVVGNPGRVISID